MADPGDREAQLARWRALIRDVPNFPQPGILFRDITPLLFDPRAREEVNEALAAAALELGATLIAGIEARGFIFGLPVAERLGLPFVPLRKPGKLPAALARVSYTLEYGESALEIHEQPSVTGYRVVMVDDLLATGGTSAAAARLIEEQGGWCTGGVFVIELTALGGRECLAAAPGAPPAVSLLRY